MSEGTVANFAIVQRGGNRAAERNVEFYNLDVIISVGYRVKSHRGTRRERLYSCVAGYGLGDQDPKTANYWSSGHVYDRFVPSILDKIRTDLTAKAFLVNWRSKYMHVGTINIKPRIGGN